jgi:transcriptional regulator with XRE-family HTH domain
MTDAAIDAAEYFAEELKAQRARAGWTQVQTGEKLTYSGSFVSDVERCARPPSQDFAQACDRVFETPGTFERWYEVMKRGVYPSWFSSVVPHEAAAVRIHGWELGPVPGLLQTEDYARSLIQASRPQDSDGAVEVLVMARMERQAILAAERRPVLWYVLDESVLRRAVGGPDVMDAQMDKLIAAGSAGGTVLQVLPFVAGDQAGADGPITVYESANAPTVCYTECYRGGRLVDDPGEVADIMMTLNMLRASALSPRDSLEMMRRIRRESHD